MMQKIHLKCPECGKRGLESTRGKRRGKFQEKSLRERYAMSSAEREEYQRAQTESTTWDMECRYCRFKKNILHRELIALEKADPVYMQKRRQHYEKLGEETARRMSRIFGIKVTVKKGK